MPLVVNKDPDTFRSGFAFWNSQTDVMSLATPSDRKVIFAATLFICVRSSFPLLDFFVTGDPDNRLPNTANVAFEYIEGEGILLLLNKEGIAASSGSACTSGSPEPSHVLRAMNIPYTAAHGAIRLSLSRDNTDDEVDHVLAVMPDIVDKLRGISPFWSKEGAPQAFDPAYA